MDFLETSLSLAMALNYLRERARERNNQQDAPPKLSILLLSAQIMGQALMTTGIALQLTGKQLIILGQQSTS